MTSRAEESCLLRKVACCMFGILFKYFQNIKDTNKDASPLRDGNSKTANKKKVKKRLMLSYIQGGEKTLIIYSCQPTVIT